MVFSERFTLQCKSGVSITSSAVARFNNKLDYLDMGTFQIPLPSTAMLERLAQLNSAVSATIGQSTELLIHREIRGEKIKFYNLGFAGRPVRVANPPVQISRGTE